MVKVVIFVGIDRLKFRDYIQVIENYVGMEFLENLAGQFSETFDEKLNKLKRKLEHLESKEHDVKVELEYAEQLSMKKPRKEVENWLQEVGRTKTEVQVLEARVKEKSIFKHLSLRNSIDRYTTEVNQLIQRGVFSGGLTLQVCDSGVPLVTTELVGKRFQENKKMIWERVMNNNISSVGVYGMGGVGKTTLITHIYNQLLDHPSSSVAWVSVSQNCSTFKLQDDIAKVLGIGPLDEKDERKRAAVLASALRKRKTFVLILDDIWEYIKLDEVGIPANEIGCKLIITTRSLDVCRMMNCEEIIKVEPLSENDPWELFEMHLGHIAILPSQIKEIAKSLVNEFGGLPLGIILAAGCLRGVDDICQWNDALEQMKDPSLGQVELEFDMAIKIASMNSPRFLVGVEATDKLEDDKLMEDTVRMSLIISDFGPVTHHSRSLESSIHKLPTSVYNLQCLTSLVLRDCFLLKYMSSLENLKALRRFEEIASLRKLETLRTSFRDLNDFNACVNSWKDGGPADYSLAVRKDCFFNERMEYYYETIGNAVYLYEDDPSSSRGVERSASSALHTATFSCLKKIKIWDCHGIKRLFTLALLYNLQNLEVLKVGYCFKMAEIIEPSDELDPQETSSSISSTLPNLSHLELYRLPELKIFCSNIKMDFPSLKHIYIEECPKLQCFLPLPPVPPSKEVAGTTFTMPKLERFLPLPPLRSSKDVAGSTSTIISLEEIEVDEKKGRNGCLCNYFPKHATQTPDIW
ncbi:hypothetical protein FNV43_RR21058 [Rhamnella rubrinervis]|uniref:AAA+ ATPase domain-containing protein n=1 Tax=Rhamnella rubrinervis TaxID=2594499 RepID=A0A8K0GUR7_9ROSA|nr:hypothetical protein FNV43_RR21058 [Rhamnella rubrinervis]